LERPPVGPVHAALERRDLVVVLDVHRQRVQDGGGGGVRRGRSPLVSSHRCSSWEVHSPPPGRGARAPPGRVRPPGRGPPGCRFSARTGGAAAGPPDAPGRRPPPAAGRCPPPGGW